MTRTMTPSGTPTPMPILAEVLRPAGGGVGEVLCVVEETDVEEVDREAAGREEEVDTMGEVNTKKEDDAVEEITGEKGDTIKTVFNTPGSVEVSAWVEEGAAILMTSNPDSVADVKTSSFVCVVKG